MKQNSACSYPTSYCSITFGPTWCDEYFEPGASQLPRKITDRSVPRTESSVSEDRYRYQHRVERLAELLYNLQDVEGIAGRRASIQEGFVESTCAELEFAGHFIQREVMIRFRNLSGIKGNDYDFDAVMGQPSSVAR